MDQIIWALRLQLALGEVAQGRVCDCMVISHVGCTFGGQCYVPQNRHKLYRYKRFCLILYLVWKIYRCTLYTDISLIPSIRLTEHKTKSLKSIVSIAVNQRGMTFFYLSSSHWGSELEEFPQNVKPFLASEQKCFDWAMEMYNSNMLD